MAASFLPRPLFELLCQPADGSAGSTFTASDSPDCTVTTIRTVLYTATACAILAYAYISFLNLKILKWKKLAGARDEELRESKSETARLRSTAASLEKKLGTGSFNSLTSSTI